MMSDIIAIAGFVPTKIKINIPLYFEDYKSTASTT